MTKITAEDIHAKLNNTQDPDREVDFALFGLKSGLAECVMINMCGCDVFGVYLDKSGKRVSVHDTNVPFYTSHLAAAIVFAEAICPGVRWMLKRTRNEYAAGADMISDEISPNAYSKHPAIALLTAVMEMIAKIEKAEAQSEGE